MSEEDKLAIRFISETCTIISDEMQVTWGRQELAGQPVDGKTIKAIRPRILPMSERIFKAAQVIFEPEKEANK